MDTTDVDRLPYIFGLQPQQGPISGGSSITLIGTNLKPVYPAIGALFNDTPDGCPALIGIAQLYRRLDWKFIFL